jgi:hypothetical protein
MVYNLEKWPAVERAPPAVQPRWESRVRQAFGVVNVATAVGAHARSYVRPRPRHVAVKIAPGCVGGNVSKVDPKPI